MPSFCDRVILTDFDHLQYIAYLDLIVVFSRDFLEMESLVALVMDAGGATGTVGNRRPPLGWVDRFPASADGNFYHHAVKNMRPIRATASPGLWIDRRSSRILNCVWTMYSWIPIPGQLRSIVT